MITLEEAVADKNALDRIAEMLRDPDWGVGMLEDIADIVRETGREIETTYRCDLCSKVVRLANPEAPDRDHVWIDEQGEWRCPESEEDEPDNTHEPEPIDTWDRH